MYTGQCVKEKQLKFDTVELLYLSLHVGSTAEPQAMYTLSLGHVCSTIHKENILNKYLSIYEYNKQHLTASTTSSIPPVYTNSCLSTLRSISLQAGAGVIATIAIIFSTGFQIW